MRLNANGCFLIEANDKALEAISPEGMECLLSYIAKNCPNIDYLQTMGIDSILSEYFIHLANQKLEEVADEMADHPPVYSKEESCVHQWLMNALKKSVEQNNVN